MLNRSNVLITACSGCTSSSASFSGSGSCAMRLAVFNADRECEVVDNERVHVLVVDMEYLEGDTGGSDRSEAELMAVSGGMALWA